MNYENRKDALLALFIEFGGEGNRELINSKISEYWIRKNYKQQI